MSFYEVQYSETRHYTAVVEATDEDDAAEAAEADSGIEWRYLNEDTQVTRLCCSTPGEHLPDACPAAPDRPMTATEQEISDELGEIFNG